MIPVSERSVLTISEPAKERQLLVREAYNRSRTIQHIWSDRRLLNRTFFFWWIMIFLGTCRCGGGTFPFLLKSRDWSACWTVTKSPLAIADSKSHTVSPDGIDEARIYKRPPPGSSLSAISSGLFLYYRRKERGWKVENKSWQVKIYDVRF